MRQERLGRYLLVEELGRGAMGTVYRAHDPRLDRTVALKAIRFDPSSPEQQDFRDRFKAEAKSAGRLSHPNIVTIHDFGEVEDTAYIAMEFLQGETLRSLMRKHRFSVRRAVRYACQIADGLAAAHAEGVVHRDIKPANIVRLPNGVIKITDFGIAQLSTSHLTHAGTVMGTPKYMSPEQANGTRVDGRSDIFALGVMLYEMVTGATPFAGSTMTSVMYQIVHEHPIHPLKWNDEVTPSLSAIIALCLAKDPARRYQSAADLARDLRLLRDEDVTIVGPEDVFLPLEPLAAAAGSRPDTSSVERTLPLSGVAARSARPPAPVAAVRRMSRLNWRHGAGAIAVAIAAFTAAMYVIVGAATGHPANGTTASGTEVVAPPAAAVTTEKAPTPLVPEVVEVPAVPVVITASTNDVAATSGIRLDSTLHPVGRKKANSATTRTNDTGTIDAAPVAVARPVPAPAVQPAAPPAAAPEAPTGFSGFLKAQHDCIVDGKCAPRPDPNEIRN